MALLLPAFALFSTLQVGCSSDTTDSKKDDFAHEDPKPGPAGTYGDPYNNGGGYDDDDNGYDTYGYE